MVVKEKPTSWKTKYRDYRKADYNKIREEIQADEYTKEEGENTESIWNKLKERLSKAVDRNVPLKERTTGKQPKPMWWNRKIKRMRKNRLKWWNKYNESSREMHQEKYLYYQREVSKEIIVSVFYY